MENFDEDDEELANHLETVDSEFLHDDYQDNFEDFPTDEELLVNIPLTPKSKIEWIRSPFFAQKPKLDEVESYIPGYQNVQIPLVYFSRYFNDDDFQKIADFTNMYASQKGAQWSTHTNKWEIRTFISLHILMGCLKFTS